MGHSVPMISPQSRRDKLILSPGRWGQNPKLPRRSRGDDPLALPDAATHERTFLFCPRHGLRASWTAGRGLGDPGEGTPSPSRRAALHGPFRGSGRPWENAGGRRPAEPPRERSRARRPSPGSVRLGPDRRAGGPCWPARARWPRRGAGARAPASRAPRRFRRAGLPRAPAGTPACALAAFAAGWLGGRGPPAWPASSGLGEPRRLCRGCGVPGGASRPTPPSPGFRDRPPCPSPRALDAPKAAPGRGQSAGTGARAPRLRLPARSERALSRGAPKALPGAPGLRGCGGHAVGRGGRARLRDPLGGPAAPRPCRAAPRRAAREAGPRREGAGGGAGGRRPRPGLGSARRRRGRGGGQRGAGALEGPPARGTQQRRSSAGPAERPPPARPSRCPPRSERPRPASPARPAPQARRPASPRAPARPRGAPAGAARAPSEPPARSSRDATPGPRSSTPSARDARGSPAAPRVSSRRRPAAPASAHGGLTDAQRPRWTAELRDPRARRCAAKVRPARGPGCEPERLRLPAPLSPPRAFFPPRLPPSPRLLPPAPSSVPAPSSPRAFLRPRAFLLPALRPGRGGACAPASAGPPRRPSGRLGSAHASPVSRCGRAVLAPRVAGLRGRRRLLLSRPGLRELGRRAPRCAAGEHPGGSRRLRALSARARERRLLLLRARRVAPGPGPDQTLAGGDGPEAGARSPGSAEPRRCLRPCSSVCPPSPSLGTGRRRRPFAPRALRAGKVSLGSGDGGPGGGRRLGAGSGRARGWDRCPGPGPWVGAGWSAALRCPGSARSDRIGSSRPGAGRREPPARGAGAAGPSRGVEPERGMPMPP
ncbi:collagen alpha-1(I) chain-like [Suncus etruscus]|uniref:collagen alpha-1(I) chain-like n=1 Tax=Suncus etruscus TaxID=109475 RepID=UPI00210F5341|nr:collagen alpha-1(I) chain-like [Suncus etruscus]